MKTSKDPMITGADADSLSGFLQNIVAASTEYSIIGQDLDGRILLWNEGARRLYGYEPEEVVGQANSDILYTPEDDSYWAHRVTFASTLCRLKNS